MTYDKDNLSEMLMNPNADKEHFIRVFKSECTPDKVARNIARVKEHLIGVAKLIGKNDALKHIENDKNRIWPIGLSSFELTQLRTNGFDEEEFVRSLPDSEYAA